MAMMEDNASDTSNAVASSSKGRQPAKRGARACVACRRLKKTCVPVGNGSDSCKRCESSGLECAFDRPASSVIDDAGLTRLSAIEATVSTQERRLDTLVGSVGTLNEILSWLRNGSSPIPHPSQTPPASAIQLSNIAPHPPTAANLPGFANLHRATSTTSPSFAHNDPSPIASTSTQGAPSSASRLEALATLASSTEPAGQDVDRFASRLHAPIQALADAADQLSSEQDVEGEKNGTLGDREGSANKGRDADDSSSSRPKKRHRNSIHPSTTESSTTELDVVAKGFVSERDARAFILFHHKELHPFCAILDPDHDTFFTIRKNRFLFDVLMYTTLRVQEGNAQPTPQLLQVVEHVRDAVKGSIFDSSPPVETIQALLVMACWHDEPYILSGYALRLALSARLDTTFAQIDAHGWDKKDAKARQLTVQLRTWLYAVFLEFKHSRCTDRLIILRQQDVDFLRDNADRLLQMPFSIKNDLRTVANLKLTFIERGIMETGRILAQERDTSKHLAYILETREVLSKWHSDYDALLAVHDPAPLAWRRRSHLRHLQEAFFFLPANILGQRLLNPSNPPELLEIGHHALLSARAMIRTVIHSPAYASSLKYSGYLMRVDLSFAAVLMLKLAKLFPEAVGSPDEIVKDMNELIDRLSECAGGSRFTSLLRFAKEHYIASTYKSSTSGRLSSFANSPMLNGGAMKDESPGSSTSNGNDPRSGSMASGHFPPTLPGASFPRSSSQVSTPYGMLPPPVPTTPTPFVKMNGNGNGALLPGETEIIWPEYGFLGTEGMTPGASGSNADWFGGPQGLVEWVPGVPDQGWPLNWG